MEALIFITVSTFSCPEIHLDCSCSHSDLVLFFYYPKIRRMEVEIQVDGHNVSDLHGCLDWSHQYGERTVFVLFCGRNWWSCVVYWIPWRHFRHGVYSILFLIISYHNIDDKNHNYIVSPRLLVLIVKLLLKVLIDLSVEFLLIILSPWNTPSFILPSRSNI